jgi:hypothetical protein
LIAQLDPNDQWDSAPAIIIAFDEAHVLTKMQSGPESALTNVPWSIFYELRRTLRYINTFPCFSLFLSTNGKMNQFTPTPEKDSSGRVRTGELTLLPPFCELDFDQLATSCQAAKSA